MMPRVVHLMFSVPPQASSCRLVVNQSTTRHLPQWPANPPPTKPGRSFDSDLSLYDCHSPPVLVFHKSGLFFRTAAATYTVNFAAHCHHAATWASIPPLHLLLSGCLTLRSVSRTPPQQQTDCRLNPGFIIDVLERFGGRSDAIRMPEKQWGGGERGVTQYPNSRLAIGSF